MQWLETSHILFLTVLWVRNWAELSSLVLLFHMVSTRAHSPHYTGSWLGSVLTIFVCQLGWTMVSRYLIIILMFLWRFFWMKLTFLKMAAPAAYGSSWARDWIWATAITYTIAVAMLDPLTYCTRPGIKPVSPQQSEPLPLDSWPTLPQWELQRWTFKSVDLE